MCMIGMQSYFVEIVAAFAKHQCLIQAIIPKGREASASFEIPGAATASPKRPCYSSHYASYADVMKVAWFVMIKIDLAILLRLKS